MLDDIFVVLLCFLNQLGFFTCLLTNFNDLQLPHGHSYWQANRWDLIPQNDTITAHPLDGEIYAQILNMSCSYDVFFHGSLETFELSQQMYTFGEKNYATVNLLALEIITTPEASEYGNYWRMI